MLDYLGSLILQFIEKWGYFGIFITMSLESAAMPIPSEIVMTFSGFLVNQGMFNFEAVVIVGTFANLFGSLILYFVGLKGGRWFLEEYGKYILIHKNDLKRADRWFEKYGNKAVFFSRLLPAVRTFISLPAGITRSYLKPFILLTFFGSLIWNFALVYTGFLAGENWNILHPLFKDFDFVVMGAGILFVIWYIYQHIKKKYR